MQTIKVSLQIKRKSTTTKKGNRGHTSENSFFFVIALEFRVPFSKAKFVLPKFRAPLQ